MQEQSGFVFGPFRLDVRDERLWRGPDVLPVRHKTLAGLHALVAQAGQLLTKEALFADVWPETAVSETVLTVALRALRRGAGGDARPPPVLAAGPGWGTGSVWRRMGRGSRICPCWRRWDGSSRGPRVPGW